MVYETTMDGLTVRTGDLICTVDGGGELLAGEFWRLIGKLIPGKVDHIVVYVGPDGRCVEAGATGFVIEFEVADHTWNADAMFRRRFLIDGLYGVADPIDGRGLSGADAAGIREAVAEYCLEQARERKPYNLNFLNSETENAFYCSQLAYKAYLPHGIDLNTNIGVPKIPGTKSIVFPQEIWNECRQQKAKA